MDQNSVTQGHKGNSEHLLPTMCMIYMPSVCSCVWAKGSLHVTEQCWGGQEKGLDRRVWGAQAHHSEKQKREDAQYGQQGSALIPC